MPTWEEKKKYDHGPPLLLPRWKWDMEDMDRTSTSTSTQVKLVSPTTRNLLSWRLFMHGGDMTKAIAM